ncbi:molybdopterin/thiamine biosynthesis adenylyltransferase [Bradyrhizobium ottawaense]
MLSPDELERYARHIVLRDVGGPGQAALKRASALVVGAGGLGAPALMYLAAAGIGTLGVVDDDVVSLSNLQRQVIHTTPDIGRHKVESAAERIAALNPHVRFVGHATWLNADNALSLIGDYDLVLDGSDNFSTRYLVSDACFFAKRPLITAALGTFDGSLTTIRAHETNEQGEFNPTYRCLFPEAPSAGYRSGLRGSRRHGCAGGRAGIDDGDGGDPRDRRFRRRPGRPPPDDRCARDALRDAALRARSGQPAQWRRAGVRRFEHPPRVEVAVKPQSMLGSTRSGGLWASRKVRMLMITFSPISTRPSIVAEPICGNSVTLPALASRTSFGLTAGSCS